MCQKRWIFCAVYDNDSFNIQNKMSDPIFGKLKKHFSDIARESMLFQNEIKSITKIIEQLDWKIG